MINTGYASGSFIKLILLVLLSGNIRFTSAQWPNLYPYDVLGTTVYDLQTHGAMQQRLFVFSDGAIGGVWTMGYYYPQFYERGTGYIYFDGNSWQSQPSERIENMRTGWPCYAPFGVNGEAVLSHIVDTINTEGLLICTRLQRGSGDWQYQQITGPPMHEGLLWGRLITSGPQHETIHILAVLKPTSNGGLPYHEQDPPLLYYRSPDGGQTWDKCHYLFPELDSSKYLNIPVDNYVWAQPRGDTIAFAFGSLYHDLILMKSCDAGDTWNKTIVWKHPYPFYHIGDSTTSDTLYCCDGSLSLLLDKSGKAHLAFGIDLLFHPEPGSNWCFYPPPDGIGYWNESMPLFPSTHRSLRPDSLAFTGNLIGWSQDIDGNGQLDFLDDLMIYRTRGISTMPSLAISEDNTIFLAYASTTELYDNGIYNFKHIWIRSSTDGGNTWGGFTDLTHNLSTVIGEFVFPVLACNENGTMRLICQHDDDPGTARDEDHAYHENQIWCIDLDEFVVSGDDENSFDWIQCTIYPNPAGEYLYLEFPAGFSGTVVVSLYDFAGKNAGTLVPRQIIKGGNVFETGLEGLESGVYLIEVTFDGASVVRKLVISDQTY